MNPTLCIQDQVDFANQAQQFYIQQIQSFLTSCAKAPLIGVKEPRIVPLCDFWFEAARRAGLVVKVIIPVRHPDEVAASLTARDGASLELSNVLWLKYNLLAERQSRPFVRVFVEYNNLLNGWRREINRVSGALSVQLVAPNDGTIESFLDPYLYHHRQTGKVTEVFGEPWTKQVYAALSDAARDSGFDLQRMDRIFDAYSKFERTFRIALDDFRCRFVPAGHERI